MTEQSTNAEQSMNTVIHAAFRRDLLRFHHALDAFPSGSAKRAEQLGVAWDNLAYQLHHHHEDEETIFWPTFKELGADESLIGDLAGEHAAMLQALDAANEAMRKLRANPVTPNAREAEAAIDALGTVLLAHLQHEEQTIEPFNVAHLHTAPMKRARTAVRKAHKGNAGTFVSWLRDGISDQNRRTMNKEIPPPVQTVMMLASTGRRYKKSIAPVWR